MIVKLFVCLGICFVILLCSLVCAAKGVVFADSEKTNEEIFGCVIIIAAGIVLLTSLSGMIILVIKLFNLYLYGSV